MHEVILSPSHIDDVGSAHLASSLTCFPAKMPYYMLCRSWAFAMVTFFFFWMITHHGGLKARIYQRFLSVKPGCQVRGCVLSVRLCC